MQSEKSACYTTIRELHGKAVFSLVYKFFPGGTFELMLQIRDGFRDAIAKYLAEDGVVGHPEFASYSATSITSMAYERIDKLCDLSSWSITCSLDALQS